MKNSIKKFLEFNGKNIYFLAVDGTYWIAIKPICEALGVDYIRQFKKLKDNSVLSRALSEQTMHDASGRLQKMTSLPEFFVYGWIFGIQSSSPKLLEYQWKCYEILYNYFHGSVTGREDLLKEKVLTGIELRNLQNKISGNEDYKMIHELKEKQKKISSSLRKLDKEVIDNQILLFDSK
jgi:hypothetical protein